MQSDQSSFISQLHRVGLFVGAILLLSPALSFAQTYSRLSPNSDLYCVYLPNGKTQIAIGKGNSYRHLNFKSATKRTAKDTSLRRRKAKTLTKLIKKLEKQRASGGITANLTPKEVKTAQKFFLEGELPTEVSASISDNIQKFELIRATYYNDIRYNRELIKLIRNCRKRKVPSPGTFETIFYNVMTSNWNAEHDSSGSGYVLVLAKVPAYIATRYSYLCYDHPTQSTRYKVASTDPCYAEGIKNFLTEDCANIVERDSKGRPEFYLAALDKRNFFFKNRPNATSFQQAASNAETALRTGDIYGWGDSVPYAVVNNADACQQSAFQ
ncbi:MAG: hypothetical protein KDD64_10370 [Bdellovibrionales bacterium]|nr:hypothetical protein [Bdellovibrionales bacterium]